MARTDLWIFFFGRPIDQRLSAAHVGGLLFGPTVAIVSACGLASGQKYRVFIAIKSSASTGG